MINKNQISKIAGAIKSTVVDAVTSMFSVSQANGSVVIGGKCKVDKTTATEILLEAIRAAEADIVKLPNQDIVQQLWKGVVSTRTITNGLGGRDPIHAVRARCATISLLTKICVYLKASDVKSNSPKVIRCMEVLIREHAAFIVGVRYYGNHNSIREAAISLTDNLRTRMGYLVRARKYVLSDMWHSLPQLTRDERFGLMEYLASIEFSSTPTLWATILENYESYNDKLQLLRDTEQCVKEKLEHFANNAFLDYRRKITYPLGLAEIKEKAAKLFYYRVILVIAEGAEAADTAIKARQTITTQ